ncbi:AlpA family transcriptional regulator [Acinetobacter sp. Ac_3412]|uniref:AlpA family phage regulatory protein n=1 Tax=Acinetobacter sp. Ac_3412 TaxID=1848935 RepID=UPI00148F97E8|nr:AlpA family phage regulatory protein [Acinetobacter sp. Ac_3412]NNP77694.1 AlpA family transcriptional regulator [Acinetobacter sp. Ac_3412]
MIKLRLTKKEVCTFLSVTASKLDKMMQEDDSFPRKYKDGTARQAAVYFDYQEIIDWWNSKKAANDQNAILVA